MGKSRTRFTRLGAHTARDTVKEIRKHAAAGDPAALRELEAVRAAATAESLQEKIWEIVRRHLDDAHAILSDAGGGPPPYSGLPSGAYAVKLHQWLDQVRDAYEFDSPQGRSVEIVELCRHILESLDWQPEAFRLGVVLGYGLSHKNHLLVREFGDGPALARENFLHDARADGGKARSETLLGENVERDKIIHEAFAAAKAKNAYLSKQSWARTNAQKFGISADRVRKILGKSP